MAGCTKKHHSSNIQIQIVRLKQKQETIEDTYIDVISKESPIWIENNNLLDWLKVFK